MSAMPVAVEDLEPEEPFEQERWRLEELAATRVLDDRDALHRIADARIDSRTANAKVTAARALESRPAIAAAAHAGELSWGQLRPLLEVSTPATDAEWAARGPNLAPIDLERMVRQSTRVTGTEAAARREARFVRTWRDGAQGVGPEIEGIRLAPETVAGLLPNAKVRDCEIDGTGLAKTVTGPRKALPADVERHIRRRDLHCRRPGCRAPADEIHHLEPVVEFGETTDVHKLVGVCTADHRILAPHGPYRLVGNPEQPHGLRLVHRDDLSRDGPDP